MPALVSQNDIPPVQGDPDVLWGFFARAWNHGLFRATSLRGSSIGDKVVSFVQAAHHYALFEDLGEMRAAVELIPVLQAELDAMPAVQMRSRLESGRIREALRERGSELLAKLRQASMTPAEPAEETAEGVPLAGSTDAPAVTAPSSIEADEAPEGTPSTHFPWHVFLPWERDFYSERAEAVGINPEGIALQGLPAKAAALQRTCVVTGHGDPDLWTSIFFVEVAATAQYKSAIRTPLDRPVAELEILAEADRRRSRAAFAASEALAKRAALEATRLAYDAEPEHRDQLRADAERAWAAYHDVEERGWATLRLMTGNASWAAIKSMMALTGRLYLSSDEGRSLLGLITNPTDLCGAYSHSTLNDDRTTRSGATVVDPALTMALAVQPGVLGDILRNRSYQDQGLLGRFLYHSSSIRRPGRPRYSGALAQQYRSRVTELARHPLAETREGCPVRFSIEGEVFERYLDFRSEAYARHEDGDLADNHGWGKRMAENMLRVAGILHGWQTPEFTSAPMPMETLEAAISIMEYLAEHTKALFEQARTTPGTLAQKILNWISGQAAVLADRRFSLRRMQKNCFNKLSIADLEPALQQLVDDGWLRELPRVNNARWFQVLRVPTRHPG